MPQITFIVDVGTAGVDAPYLSGAANLQGPSGFEMASTGTTPQRLPLPHPLHPAPWDLHYAYAGLIQLVQPYRRL